jgi:hypothetical protein
MEYFLFSWPSARNPATTSADRTSPSEGSRHRGKFCKIKRWEAAEIANVYLEKIRSLPAPRLAAPTSVDQSLAWLSFPFKSSYHIIAFVGHCQPFLPTLLYIDSSLSCLYSVFALSPLRALNKPGATGWFAPDPTVHLVAALTATRTTYWTSRCLVPPIGMTTSAVAPLRAQIRRAQISAASSSLINYSTPLRMHRRRTPW